jgi:hypothetical protein
MLARILEGTFSHGRASADRYVPMTERLRVAIWRSSESGCYDKGAHSGRCQGRDCPITPSSAREAQVNRSGSSNFRADTCTNRRAERAAYSQRPAWPRGAGATVVDCFVKPRAEAQSGAGTERKPPDGLRLCIEQPRCSALRARKLPSTPELDPPIDSVSMTPDESGESEGRFGGPRFPRLRRPVLRPA